MKHMAYLCIAVVGLLVGAIYALLRVKSPAPPLIAIVGLAGMLAAATVLGKP
jgi:XapX domain-containing protein